MHKRFVTNLVVLGALVATALPIMLSFYVSQDQGRQERLGVAQSYAGQLVESADASAAEIDEAIQRLKGIASVDPCSQARQAAMRDLEVSQSHLRIVGAVSGDAITCSSLGQPEPIPIGPLSFVTPHGWRVRLNVTLSMAREQQFLVVERDGFATVLNKDVIIDLPAVESDASLAVYARVNGAILSSRGYLNEDWLRANPERANTATIENGYAVAIRSSRRFEIAVVAAIPLRGMNQKTPDVGVLFLLVTLLSGIGMAASAVYFYRLRTSLSTSLKTAFRRGEFFMVYLPVVDLSTGQWVGAEALIRWRRPDGEIVRPDLFIPLAEASGLIVEITAHVMELIGRDATDLFREFPHFHLSFNLSAADFFDLETPRRVRQLVSRTAAGAGNLIAEVTERSFVDVVRANSVLAELRRFEIATAIDDFGTGYSSLSHLGRLRLDYLKIDKSFVDSLATDVVTGHVIDHIIEMAKSLDLQMIAEGVENEIQAQKLRTRGVQFAQGWFFAKPMAFTELVKRLRE
ncbi:putative cyclic di-GMP phosphodiesterase PdeC [Paraburkholderia aspalathi]|uniref:EAL domain-containing protein n=1 Tax=Paraburkholderia aspalathi TaxID=1324617 RepID=UPI00190B8DA6|nr:EAL domain-containing protein [Paraburkholderia aspalathi]MBK3844361.1 EAL domain-containing protein [Paraburkholderia aspalathi]CAE6840875.1 putative cyclic di-GMP phosphodiesterase PdeC [Paraburkholderia aspalathi]CAE6871404.1 putative cyclic di-GMP phosphodiesterase PdeC [Paraburkholderia aspalathi]